MDEARAPRRQAQFSRGARNRRSLGRLREGRACHEFARGEALTERRVRQIFADPLKRREVVEGGTLAVQQIDQLGFAMRAASEARAEGDVKAMAPFIEALDRHDRCRGLGGVRGNRNAPQATENARNGSRTAEGTDSALTLPGRGRLRREQPRIKSGSNPGVKSLRLPDRRVAALQRLAMTPKPAAAREPQRAASF